MQTADESGFASVNGINMYYAVYGTGDPVLLIHGGLSNADVWSSQVAALSKTYKVIVADSRGHGRSTRGDQPMSYDLMAADYLALLDRLKIERCALVGWSDGGVIGLDIAINHPERLTRLYVQGAHTDAGAVSSSAFVSWNFATFFARAWRDYIRLSDTPWRFPLLVAELNGMWGREPHWTPEQVASIRVPTEVVAAEHDRSIKLEHTQFMAATIPGAKYVLLSRVDHFALLQDPDGFNRSVLDFLKAGAAQTVDEPTP
ncbi:alpha/beta hydrolase [Mesorhizobium soli]|uniref:Alpha/beta hydrolase n=2 Tax=Pseudaminobacter soli (ex Li et al. 2025) TaxID=1295366 RepID=A0A2P7SP28_9HYPH|nr:alpha/beta hydrolase [Mesorhizobium soli]